MGSTHEHTHDPHTHGAEEDSYIIDQLCTVALSAAFGGVCLAMYYWKTDMLTRLLGPQFHMFVLISGFTLVGLALLRAFSLWKEAGASKHTHSHEHHDHAHDHDEHHHEHGEACQHDHGHDHEHAHGHEPGHAHHHHHHDHGPEDHDHGWVPARYVVLLIPVILFMLGLPNKGPKAVAQDSTFTKDQLKREACEAVGLLSPSSLGWSQLVYIGYLSQDQAQGNVQDFDFRNLLPAVAAAATSPDPNVRDQWKNKTIRVIGMYSPSRGSDREFRLVRFKLTCCVADAIPLDLPIVCRESIRNIKDNSWVRVTGRVEFRKRLDTIVPIIVVPESKNVEPWVEDLNPYN